MTLRGWLFPLKNPIGRATGCGLLMMQFVLFITLMMCLPVARVAVFVKVLHVVCLCLDATYLGALVRTSLL